MTMPSGPLPCLTRPVVDPVAQERIHCLWDELATYEAAESDVALMNLLGRVADMVDAQNAYWMGAVRMTDDDRDPLRGWRPRLIRYLRPLPCDERLTKRRIEELGRGLDESTVAHARLAGTYRARRFCDLLSPEWFRSEYYQSYLDRGICDSLVVAAPVSPVAEAYYGFLRMRAEDPFTEAQRDIASYALRGLTWFHRQILLAHGFLVARAPLSPMERRVLALLLTDRSEKQIAGDLEVSPSTAHTYVRDVFRKFGVSGRSGLIAVWLGRQNGSR